MQNLRLLPAFILAGLVSLPLAARAQLMPGTIQAFNVTGDVQLVDAEGSRPLNNGDPFTEGTTVETGPASSVTLVQSNGSVLVLEEETSLAVEEFLQEPFNMTADSFLDLEEDPSRSRTRLRLNYGELSGETKRLRPNSSYEIMTPAGTADIRGTIWSVRVLVQIVDGIVEIAVTVAEGQVNFNNTPVPAGFTNTATGELNEGATETNFEVIDPADGSMQWNRDLTRSDVASRFAEAVKNYAALAKDQQSQLSAGKELKDFGVSRGIFRESTQQGQGTTPPNDTATAVETFSPGG